MTECKHPSTRFVPGHPKDTLPGYWQCDGCGMKFTSDINDLNSIRYLEKPKTVKTLPPIAKGGDH